jgi:mono/diheme cytochrome c family protein
MIARKYTITILATTFSFLVVSPMVHGQAKAELSDFFENSIRPVLADNCLKCHGPDKAKGGLRLDSRAALLQGGNSGPAAVAGKPAESLLIAALRHDGDTRMPPSGKLPDVQVRAFVRWVETGLYWPETAHLAKPGTAAMASDLEKARHWWSFQPVRRPVIPSVRDASWPKGDIDRFIIADLEKHHLRPAAVADKRTLLRRATFDLTGLPPTPSEIDTFLNDHSPGAFAQVVDRLLASPQYGERWGRHWLDLVRYTDSFDARILSGPGQEMDTPDAWRYRDWVVQAFNRDLPYNRFILEQLAGDRLAMESGKYDPNPVIATGLLAIGNWGGGDADKEKLLTDIVDDQVDVVGRGFLGLTLACARCHDHKFDPISTEDYYGLAGIFFSSHILKDLGPKTNGPPMLRIPLASRKELEWRRRRDALLTDLDSRQKMILAKLPQRAQEQGKRELARYLAAAWEYRQSAATNRRQTITAFAQKHDLEANRLRRWTEFLALPGEERHLLVPVRNLLDRPGLYAWRGAMDTPSFCVNTSDAAQTFQSIKLPSRSVAIHPSPAGGVAVDWHAPVVNKVQVSGLVADADATCGDGLTWRLEHHRGTQHTVLAKGIIPNGGKADLGKNELVIEMSPGDVVRLVILPNKEYTCDTTRIELMLQETTGAKRVWNLTEEFVKKPLVGNPRPDQYGHAETWHLLDLAPHALSPAAVHTPAWIAWQKSLGEAKLHPDRRSRVDEAARALQGAMSARDVATNPNAALWGALTSPDGPLSVPPDEGLLPLADRAAIALWRGWQKELLRHPLPPLPVAQGCLEGGCPQSPQAGIHDVRVHVRGRYDRLGPVVPRRMPLVLVRGEQPVIARNSSGRLELAQWIASPANSLTARVIVNRAWQHHFGAGLVRTPSNFGRLGVPPTHPELLDHLADEFVRDGWSIKRLHRRIMLSAAYQQSCAASSEMQQRDPDNRRLGRMNRRRLDAEALRDSLLAVAGNLDTKLGGPAVPDLQTPRRTLYLRTVRSDRTSFRELFDAADPTAIVDARSESTVAPQALFLLNHSFVRTQAQQLAARVQREEPTDVRRRIERLHLLLFGRPAQLRETTLALDWLQQHNTAQAWTDYVHLLLCTNEFLYID